MEMVANDSKCTHADAISSSSEAQNTHPSTKQKTNFIVHPPNFEPVGSKIRFCKKFSVDEHCQLVKTIHNDELLLNARVQTRSQKKGIENNNNMNFVDRKSRNTSGKMKSEFTRRLKWLRRKLQKKLLRKLLRKLLKSD